MLLLGTIFFPYIIRAGIELMVGQRNCQGGGCGALALVMGVYIKPVFLLLAALLLVVGLIGRFLRLGGWFWLAYVAVLSLPAAPALFVVGNFWAANFATGAMFSAYRMPSFSLVNLAAFLVFLCIPMERLPGYRGSLLGVRWAGWLPLGKLFAATCVIIVFNELITMTFSSIVRGMDKDQMMAIGWFLLLPRHGLSYQLGEHALSYIGIAYINIVNLALLVWLAIAIYDGDEPTTQPQQMPSSTPPSGVGRHPQISRAKGVFGRRST